MSTGGLLLGGAHIFTERTEHSEALSHRGVAVNLTHGDTHRPSSPEGPRPAATAAA